MDNFWQKALPKEEDLTPPSKVTGKRYPKKLGIKAIVELDKQEERSQSAFSGAKSQAGSSISAGVGQKMQRRTDYIKDQTAQDVERVNKAAMGNPITRALQAIEGMMFGYGAGPTKEVYNPKTGLRETIKDTDPRAAAQMDAQKGAFTKTAVEGVVRPYTNLRYELPAEGAILTSKDSTPIERAGAIGNIGRIGIETILTLEGGKGLVSKFGSKKVTQAAEEVAKQGEKITAKTIEKELKEPGYTFRAKQGEVPAAGPEPGVTFREPRDPKSGNVKTTDKNFGQHLQATLDMLKGQNPEKRLAELRTRIVRGEKLSDAEMAELKALQNPEVVKVVKSKPKVETPTGPSRQYMLGGQSGDRATMQFASEEQQLWYDAYAGRKSRGRVDLAGKGQDAAPGRLDALAKQFGMTRAQAEQYAEQVYNDVKAQMKGAKDGESRIIRDNVKGQTAELMSGFSTKLAREGMDMFRGIKLSTDVGVLARQGGAGLINHPKGFLNSLKSAMKSYKTEEEAVQALDAMNSRQIEIPRDGQVVKLDMNEVRKTSGLQLTDLRGASNLNEREEAFASKLLQKYMPGAAKLERFQTVFLNRMRTEMFDDFVQAFPNATDAELKNRAQFINSLLGRSNIQQVPESLQIMFTSPRWKWSRYEMVANNLKASGELKDLIKAKASGKVIDRASQQNLIDMGRQAGVLYGTLKAAEAAGGKIEVNDPMSPDFLKIRFGKNVYDLSSGMAAPIRGALRVVFMTLHPELNTPQRSVYTEIGKEVGGALSPGIQVPFAAGTGKGLGGYELEDTEKGLWNFAPLIMSGTYETYSKDGMLPAIARAGAEAVGIGVNRYPAKAKKQPTQPKQKKQPKQPKQR